MHQTAMVAPPTLSDVEACVAAERRGVGFPDAIEEPYQRKRQTYRAQAVRSSVVPTALVYNAFLPVDFALLPTTAWIAILLHVAITGWIFCCGWILRREPSRLKREILSVSMPMLMVAQIMGLYVLNATETADDYQYLAIMTVVYMNVNVRPDFPFALVASVVIAAGYAVALFCGSAPLSGLLIGVASMGATVYLTLMANWRMERDARHAFLHRLQDQLRRTEAEVEAGQDALTGLSNRRHLEAQAARAWAQAADRTSMAVILLDVDHFKAFNDCHGHPAGDLCLKRVAGAIRSELRGAVDVSARYGGEEFLMLLPDTDLPAAVQTAERVRRAVEGLAIPHAGVAGGRSVTVSLGVMAGPAHAHPLAELIAGADTALYAAKRNGRNQVWPPFVTRSPSGPLARPVLRMPLPSGMKQ